MLLYYTFLEIIDLLCSERRSVSLKFPFETKTNLFVSFAVTSRGTGALATASGTCFYATTQRVFIYLLCEIVIKVQYKDTEEVKKIRYNRPIKHNTGQNTKYNIQSVLKIFIHHTMVAI